MKFGEQEQINKEYYKPYMDINEAIEYYNGIVIEYFKKYPEKIKEILNSYTSFLRKYYNLNENFNLNLPEGFIYSLAIKELKEKW